MQKLVEVIEGQVKSATEEGRCKPASRSRPEKVKYCGLSKDVTWKSKLECEVNGSGWLRVCHVLVKRCLGTRSRTSDAR